MLAELFGLCLWVALPLLGLAGALGGHHQVSPVLVKGYRPGEGLDADRWPTKSVAKAVEELGPSPEQRGLAESYLQSLMLDMKRKA